MCLSLIDNMPCRQLLPLCQGGPCHPPLSGPSSLQTTIPALHPPPPVITTPACAESRHQHYPPSCAPYYPIVNNSPMSIVLVEISRSCKSNRGRVTRGLVSWTPPYTGPGRGRTVRQNGRDYPPLISADDQGSKDRAVGPYILSEPVRSSVNPAFTIISIYARPCGSGESDSIPALLYIFADKILIAWSSALEPMS